MLRRPGNSSRNILLIFSIFILVNFLGRGPDFLRYANCPADKWYTGQASWFDPWDLNIYFSAIGWGKRGGILLENPYDTESTQGAPIYTFYTLLGRITAPLSFSNAFVFHLAGLIASLFLIGAIWWFIGIFLKEETERRIAFVLLFLGGGLGWLFFPKHVLPDVGLPNFTLNRAIRVPHEAVSLGLFLLGLGGFWQSVIYQRKIFFILGALVSFLMLFFHPYSLLPLGSVLLCFGFYWWLKNDSTAFLTSLFSLGLAALVYYLSVGRELLVNQSFSGLTSQIQNSPPLFQTILGWGILSILILMAFLSKNGEKEIVFLKIWLISHWLIIYLPFNFQKLLIRGLWIPAVPLAVKGIKEASRRFKFDYHLLAILILFLASFSTLFITLKRINELAENRWIYLTKDEGETIEYLKNHGSDGEGVLASYRLANIIPAHTTKRVWVGHEFQTPDFEQKIVKVYEFFGGKIEVFEAKEFLGKAKIVWIFWGPEEKAIANLTEVPAKSLMEPVIEKETVNLYKVIPGKL